MASRKNHTYILQMVNIALFAAIITVCSQITVKLPTAVPVTLQTAGVCMAAALLGPLGGTASVAVYIMLGAFGLPVFSGFSGGIGHIYGPTGGFIMGFLPAAFVTGLIVRRYGNRLISDPRHDLGSCRLLSYRMSVVCRDDRCLSQSNLPCMCISIYTPRLRKDRSLRACLPQTRKTHQKELKNPRYRP